MFPVSSFIIKNEDRTFIHSHSLRSDWSESQVTGAVVWDLENQYPILCFGMKQCPICKKEFLSHPSVLTPELLVEYRMYFGIYTLDSDFKWCWVYQIKDQLNHTTNNVYFFQHSTLFLLFHKTHQQIGDFFLVIMSPNKVGWKNFSPQSEIFQTLDHFCSPLVLFVGFFNRNLPPLPPYFWKRLTSELDTIFVILVMLYTFPLLDNYLHVSLNLHLLKT